MTHRFLTASTAIGAVLLLATPSVAQLANGLPDPTLRPICADGEVPVCADGGQVLTLGQMMERGALGSDVRAAIGQVLGQLAAPALCADGAVATCVSGAQVILPGGPGYDEAVALTDTGTDTRIETQAESRATDGAETDTTLRGDATAEAAAEAEAQIEARLRAEEEAAASADASTAEAEAQLRADEDAAAEAQARLEGEIATEEEARLRAEEDAADAETAAETATETEAQTQADQAQADAEARARAAEAQTEADARAQSETATGTGTTAETGAVTTETGTTTETTTEATAESTAEVPADETADTVRRLTEALGGTAPAAGAEAETDAQLQTDDQTRTDTRATDPQAQTDAQTQADLQAQIEADAQAEAEADLAEEPQRAEDTVRLLERLAGMGRPEEGETPASVAAITAEGEADATVAETVETEVTAEDTRQSSEDFLTDPAGRLAARGETAAAPTRRNRDLERLALLGLGALAVGMILSNGDEVVTNTGDRVIVRRGGGQDFYVLRDDDATLRQPGSRVRTERFDDGSSRTFVTRDDGTIIITVRDAAGRVLLREREDLDGRRVTLIDDTVVYEPIVISALPPPTRRQVTVIDADATAIRAALNRETATGIDRTFSLRQVREIEQVRKLVPEIAVQPITFETASAAIRPTEAQALAELGLLMVRLIDDDPREVFLIEGHTDAVGSPAYNLALSDRRAESVALALTEYFGVPPENMVVQGYGLSDLLIQTSAAEVRNRRVTVRRITPLLDERLARN
jgi:outer membrane protein OmpA-like peptidoglycan-associated protein